MIQEIKSITPFIDFGYNITDIAVVAGQPVTIWLSPLYSDNVYETTLARPGAALVKVSDYQYQLTYSAPGNYEISITVNTKDKSASFKSNTLTITVE